MDSRQAKKWQAIYANLNNGSDLIQCPGYERRQLYAELLDGLHYPGSAGAPWMRILLNLVPLKTGGGVQVALDFLAHLATRPDNHEWHGVARAGMPFFEPRFATGLASLTAVRDSLRHRVVFDVHGGRQLARSLHADVVYTLFGPTWFGETCVAIGGCAYSNLLYPEIDFWQGMAPVQRLVRHVKDAYRRWRLLANDGTIFESENLARRAVTILRMPADRVTCVKPKASALVEPTNRNLSTAKRLEGAVQAFNVMMLCGYHPNKRLHLVPEVLRELRKRGETGIGFITTLADKGGGGSVLRLAKRYGVRDLICNVGPVAADACVELYRQADAVLLPSRLESFSNTIAEAWLHGVPLIASDLEWARSICGDAAEYFRYDDVVALTDLILTVRTDHERAARVVAAGRARIATHPSSAERHQQIVDFIRRVHAAERTYQS